MRGSNKRERLALLDSQTLHNVHQHRDEYTEQLFVQYGPVFTLRYSRIDTFVSERDNSLLDTHVRLV